jgi:hypothetical protein
MASPQVANMFGSPHGTPRGAAEGPEKENVEAGSASVRAPRRARARRRQPPCALRAAVARAGALGDTV